MLPENISVFLKAYKLREHFANKFSYALKKPTFNWYTRYLYQINLRKHSKLLESAAVDACNLRPGEYVLEIGFGKGYGLQLAVERVAPTTCSYMKSSKTKLILQKYFDSSFLDSETFKNDGYVYGVEISEYMMRKAKWRLWPYIYVNRVDLQLRSVDHLPYPASTFDACFHVDCFYFWPCLITSLKNIWRILRPDGRLVTTFQTKHLSDLSKRGWFKYGNPDPLAYVLALERSGYDRIEWIKCPTIAVNSKESYDCIIAYKPIVRLLSAPQC
ncbi:unnamed protein product [Trichobilharzia szidati]|nr:unnamed protein product [Trichobilharzia szidati]